MGDPITRIGRCSRIRRFARARHPGLSSPTTDPGRRSSTSLETSPDRGHGRGPLVTLAAGNRLRTLHGQRGWSVGRRPRQVATSRRRVVDLRSRWCLGLFRGLCLGPLGFAFSLVLEFSPHVVHGPRLRFGQPLPATLRLSQKRFHSLAARGRMSRVCCAPLP